IKLSYNARKEERKKWRKRVFALVIILLLLSALLAGVCSEIKVARAGEESKSEEEVRQQLSDAVNDAIDRLDLSELQKFIDSLDEQQRHALDINDAKETLRALVNGESKDFFSKLINLLANTLGKYFAGFLPSFITIIVICLLKNMLGGMTSGFANNSTTEVVHIVCYCAVVIVLMTGIANIVSTVTKTISTLTGFATVIFPILLTLLSMLGGATTVATYTPLMAVLSGFIMRIVSVVIVPAFIATIVFIVVGNISKTVKLDKLTKVIKSASSWLIGIVFGLFATFLTVQGITGGVVDKFGFNVAKFALSSYVPVLGGYLSDGFDLLSTSIVLVKNALGYSGALILISIVLFPLVKVVIFTLTLRLTAAIIEPIGDTRISGLLGSVANNVNLLITALTGVAFLFYILLMLLIGSCNMGI
ncbi:MAG: stage III sporulation protein AE, partial [Clostridia bacterium]|nr:stage III sporulation protein AE [Clostridia bacterium]